MAGADQIAVFADPAQTSFFGPGFVHERGTVDTGAPSTVGLLLLKPATESPEPLINDSVVVPAPAIAGNFWRGRGLLLVYVVVEGYRQHALNSRQ